MSEGNPMHNPIVIERLIKSFLHDAKGKAQEFVRLHLAAASLHDAGAREFVRLHLAAAKAIDSK